MNFDHYSDPPVLLAVDLVNTFDTTDGSDDLTDVSTLRAFLESQHLSHIGQVTAADLANLRGLRSVLREVFTAPDAGTAAARINVLLEQHRSCPHLTDHDNEHWHLHFAPDGAALPERIAIETAMGLAAVLREGGKERLRTCASATCADVFVDGSRNRSRRYCNPETCGNRANVAAYRARRRIAQAALK